jgi:glycosyltransferase involved in cell wall biosynthesis
MGEPLVTVVIDTYNCGEFLEEAVGSVLAQDFPAEQVEILVIDDGSTDDTAERMKKYEDRVRTYRKPNGGQASAFNYGFEHAHGEIIALLDADDVWLPDKLGRVCDTFAHHPEAGMVYHCVMQWRGEEESTVDPVFVAVSGRVVENRPDLLRYPMAGSSCLAFRREALRELLPLPEVLRSQADAYLTALIIEVAPVVALPEFLGKYRLHGANAFSSGTCGMSDGRIANRMCMRAALLGEIEGWFERHGHNVHAPAIEAYLKQSVKAQEVDGFLLQAPSRWRYFSHLFEYPRLYGEIMSARHRVYGYIRAFGALFLGYHHLHLLDEVHVACKRWMGKSRGEIRPA